jgi:Concanavalin A-like lectin/glucanases superfamily
MSASFRPSRLHVRAALAAGLVALLLGACSLGFDDGDLGRGASAGTAGAPSGGGGGGGTAGSIAGSGGGGAGVGGGMAGAGLSGAGGAAAGAAGAGGDDSSSPPVSLDGCVLLLHMDEPAWAGANSVTDASGQGNNGSPINGATTTADGKFGRAGEFNGANWVDVPDPVALPDALEALSYAAWVYPIFVPPEGAGIISKREGFLVNSSFTLFLYEGDRVFADIEDVRFSSLAGVTLSQWHHVAVVYDLKNSDPDRQAIVYVDGDFAASSKVDTAIAPNPRSVLIGNLIGGGDLFRGRIDDVAIWTRALAPDEIAAIYNANRPL